MTEKQVFPSSITGNGSEPAGSVLDHRFGSGDPYTLGVEEEYQLLDPQTFDLVQHIETMLERGHRARPRGAYQRRAHAVRARDHDPVCRNAADVMRWLTKLRGYVTEIAHAQNTRVGSAGTHPFSLFERQRITAKDRYRALIDQMQYVARRELIFGMHVHVAVDDPEKAVQVVNGLLPHLAPLLAMSASSPFWRGEPTGLASSRQMVFSAFPRSVPPPRFRDYSDYASVVGQLERSGCIADYTHIWWDIRLHPRLGTIEVRICDAVTRVEDAVAIAAYCQSLVKQLCERYDAGEEIPSYHRILTTENKWLAARYGLEAPVMDLAKPSRNRVPVARLSGARSASCSRTLASSAPSGSSRAFSSSSPAARRPIVSCGSTTRIATSPRSRARSRTRPRRCPFPLSASPPRSTCSPSPDGRRRTSTPSASVAERARA